MSSADSAHPADDDCQPGPPGTVIRFERRGLRFSRTRHAPQPPSPAPDTGTVTPQQRLASTMEGLYLRHGRTLSDEETAEAYRIALDAVRLMLDGCLARDLVGEGEYAHLTGMVDGMRNAPDEL